MDEARAVPVPVEGRGPPQRQGDGEIHGASPHGSSQSQSLSQEFY